MTICKFFKRMGYDIKSQKVVSICYFLIFLILSISLAFNKNNIPPYDIEYGFPDTLLITTVPSVLYYTLIPVYLFGAHIISNQLYVKNRVVRYSDIDSFFKEIFIRLIVYTTIYVVLILLISSIGGFFLSGIKNTWMIDMGQPKVIYGIETKGNLSFNGGYIIIKYFITLFFVFILGAAIYVFGYIFLKNGVLATIFSILFFSLDAALDIVTLGQFSLISNIRITIPSLFSTSLLSFPLLLLASLCLITYYILYVLFFKLEWMDR